MPMSASDVIDTTKQALKFLGNASSHIAQDCHFKIAGYLNVDVQDLIEDESQSIDDAIRKNFDKAVKEHVDAVRSLCKPTSTYGSERLRSTGSQLFFLGSRSHQGHGGNHFGKQSKKVGCIGMYVNTWSVKL